MTIAIKLNKRGAMRLSCIFLLIFFVPALGAWGNEKNIDQREYRFVDDSKDEIALSDKYHAGLYLIYDCQDMHFVCGNKDDFELCQKEREVEKKIGQKIKLPCAPFKK